MADGSVMIAMIGATKGSFGSVGSTCSTSCGAAPTQEHSSDACPSSGKAMAGGLLSASSPFLARKNVSGREISPLLWRFLLLHRRSLLTWKSLLQQLNPLKQRRTFHMDHRNGRAHRTPKALPEQISPCNQMGPCNVPLVIPCMLRSVGLSATAPCGCFTPRPFAIAVHAPFARAVNNPPPPSHPYSTLPSFS